MHIQKQEGIDPDLHALRVGEADDLTLIQQDSVDEGPYFIAPEHAAGFHRLVLHLRTDWEQRAAAESVGKFWTTSVGIEYLELPQAYSIIPNLLPAGLPASGSNHKVVVTG